MADQERTESAFEEIKVKGSQLVEKVREIIEEGNARRVTIKKDGRVLLELPLSVGVGGATAALFLMPTLAAIGAMAALVTDVHVVIEKDQPPSELDVSPPASPDASE